MRKQKCKILKELYASTTEILEPEITPVLRGSYRIQGPTDEAYHDVLKNTRSSRAEKRSNRSFLSGEARMREESGVCNVCATPCSSCMHFNRAMSCIELKMEEEFSDETSRVKAASRCSFNDAKVLPPFKNRVCRDWHTASETSNLLSASSSHGSFSENAESKATLGTSEASQDAKTLTKVSSGGTVAKNNLLSKSLNVSGQNVITSSSSHQQKGLQCDGDSISCISGANDIKKLDNLSDDVDKKTVLCSTACVSSSIPETEGCANGANIQSKRAFSHLEIEESCSKSRPLNMSKKESIRSDPAVHSATEDAMDLEINSCSLNVGEPSECYGEHTESSLAKLASAQKSAACTGNDDIHPSMENCKAGLVRSSSSGSMKVYPCLETGMGMDTVEQPAESTKCLILDEKLRKLDVSPELPDTQEPPIESLPNDESDGSDVVEDDVKVCDICGDAGREENLAFCSRCSDGAEHTYCMQVMMDKVPEGDWLCEECKMKEEAENQKQENHKQDKFETELGTSKTSCINGKSQIAGCKMKEEAENQKQENHKQDKFETELGTSKTSCINGKSQSAGNSEHFPDMDAKSLDVEASRSSKGATNPLLSSKRRPDNLEFASAAKRQALESTVGSPKPSSPSKKPALSRETSFKSLEKGKVKPFHIIPSSGSNFTNNSQGSGYSPTASGHNSSKIQPRLQSPRGTLLKSNSFNMNSKPKVKLVEENVSQKHKLVRDRAASDIKKEGIIRTITKSPSFRTASPRSSYTEAKVKLHSSNPSRTEDIKGLKLSKDRVIERKSSFKSDRFGASSTTGSNESTSKTELKGALRGESTLMLSAVGNYRDLRAVQADGKVNNSSKTTGLPSSRGSEAPNALAGRGDFKRQSSILSCGVGSLSLNGSVDQKQSQVSPKEEAVTIYAAEGPCRNSDATQQDVLPQSRESINQDRKVMEPSFSQSRPSVLTGDKTIRCLKCKEIGHAAQFCPTGNMHTPVLEASAAQSLREVMKKSSKFKDAIEAALQKRPVMYKKSKVPDQSDEFSMSSTELSCEVASKDQLLNGKESLKSSTADSFRSMTVSNVKSHTLHPTEADCPSRERESDAIVPLDGNKLKNSMSDVANLASSISIPLRLLPIPEHNYIWQGGFHVKINGRPMDLCDGIQGHLSTCASPKVREVVSKFSQRVMLEEVPRSSMWPTQFQNCATEDNIALYFFAKDLESYAKSYKSLLENMIKNDLALKGNFDGVELLIFPSNVLPEKSQRWNMLFFLWGVFRGKRASGLDQISSYQKKHSGANLNIPALEQELLTPAHSASHKDCPSGNVDDLTAFGRLQSTEKATKSTASIHLPFSLYSGRVDLNCCTEESSIDDIHSGLGSSYSMGCDTLDSNLLSKVPTYNAKSCAETKGSNTCMEEDGNHESKEHSKAMVIQEGSFGGGQILKKQFHSSNSADSDFPSISPIRQDTSFKAHPTSNCVAQDAGALGVKVEEKIQEKMENRRYEVKCEEKMEEVISDAKIAAKSVLPSDPMEKENSSSDFKSGQKRPYSSLGMAMEAFSETSTTTSQHKPFHAKNDYMLVEGDKECKKVKKYNSEMNGSDSSRDENSYSTQIHNLVPNFPIKEQKLDVYRDMAFPGSSGTAEKYFFPVDLNNCKLRGNSIPVQVLSSDDEDQLEEAEAPNLELALGAQRRPPRQGALPLFAGLADKKIDRGKQADPMAENRDDDLLAPLSLSLAFPFPDKEQNVKPVPKQEQLLPDRHRVDTSLFLFGGFQNT